MKSPKDRKAFFELFPKHGVGVEVGVFEGFNARDHLIPVCAPKQLYLVDSWGVIDEQDHGTDWKGVEANHPSGRGDLRYVSVKEMFANHIDVHILRSYSHAAATLFKDQSLDWVYVDANHEYKWVKRDIEAWLPKIKPGGFMGGHDYMEYRGFGVIHAVAECLVDKGHNLVAVSQNKHPDWLVQL